MLAILIVSVLMLVGVGRVSNALHTAVLALLCMVAFTLCDPVLATAHPLAQLATFSFLFVSIQWLYPVAMEGIRPGRWLWVTPRFVMAVAYA